jgi:hypothetical protein
VLGLSTGERGIAELAKRTATERLRGEEVRFIDLPIEARTPLGIFRSLPEGILSSAVLAKRLEKHCAHHYGHPARAFVERFVTDPVRWTKFVRRRMVGFRRKASVSELGWEHRFAERFALAYAAASLAIEAGILPWTRRQALGAIVGCYHDARAAIPDTAALLTDALARIRETLASDEKLVDLRGASHKRVPAEQLRRAHGFIKENRDAGIFYALKRAAFERLVRPLPPELVLRQLKRDGHLLTTRGRRSSWKQIMVKGLNDAKQPHACILEAFVTTSSK